MNGFFLFWKEKFVQGYLSRTELMAEAAALKNRLAGTASPVVFCHNDALLANIVYQPENQKVEREQRGDVKVCQC